MLELGGGGRAEGDETFEGEELELHLLKNMVWRAEMEGES